MYLAVHGATEKERQAEKDTDPERQGEGETKQNLILCLRKLSFSQCSFFSRALARSRKKKQRANRGFTVR